MTDPKDMVEVTQADREAAKNLLRNVFGREFASAETNVADVSRYFMRHRLTAQASRLACPDLINEDHDEAVDWITENCTAIRRDNGDLDYSLGAMIAAYEAGKASAQAQGGDVEKGKPWYETDAHRDLSRIIHDIEGKIEEANSHRWKAAFPN